MGGGFDLKCEKENKRGGGLFNLKFENGNRGGGREIGGGGYFIRIGKCFRGWLFNRGGGPFYSNLEESLGGGAI